MKQLSSLDLFYLIEEFKILENQRIETFYLDEDIFHMKVYVRGKGNLFLTNRVGKFIFLADKKLTSSIQRPKSFALYLRKYLKNSFIRKVNVVKNDRIVIFEIEKKEGEKIVVYKLVFELFLNGNILILDSNDKILNILLKRVFKDRILKVGEKYLFPPKKELDFFNIDKLKFKEKLKSSNLSLVKFLAIEFGIGGKYSEEIIFRSKIDKNKISNQIEIEEFEKLNDIIENFKKEKEDSYNIIKIKESGNEIELEKNKNIEIVDFIPKNFVSIRDDFKKKTISFNEAVFNYFSKFVQDNSNEDIRVIEKNKEILKKKNIIKKQEQLKENILKEYERLNNIGNKIYENYELVENLLKQINLVAKEKGWDFVFDKIKNDEKLSKLIKKIDLKNNEIIINID